MAIFKPRKANHMALALFDLDETLIAGDSDFEWGSHLVSIGKVDKEYYASENERFYKEYLADNLDVYEFLNFALQPLANNTYEELCDWRDDYIQQRIKPIIKPKAFDLLKKHRDAGDYLVIVTATNSFITEPTIDIFGIDDLIATEPAMEDGNFTGKVKGTPSFGPGKVTRLKEWLEGSNGSRHSLEGSYFYSDSRNDIPLLELVSNPITVDADEKLNLHAAKNNWQQISLL
jgi:HAD superfamily hydrolase (TIGR01490 family)